MALRAGELMVVVRAQDFASRTLRRVGTELGGLSREQQVLFSQQMAQAQLLGKADMAQVRRMYSMREAFKQDLAMTNARAMAAQNLTNASRQITAATAARGGAAMTPAEVALWKNATTAAKEYGITTRNVGEELQKAQVAQAGFSAGLKTMNAQRIQDIGHAMSATGRTLQLVGLIGTAVFGAMANSFAGFNREATLAATQTYGIAGSFKNMGLNVASIQNTIIDQMQKFPATGTEMAKSLYDIYSSMNVTFGQGKALLYEFNKLSVATLTDLETATNAGITVLNNFGKSGMKMSRIMDIMVATVRFGRMRLSDFNDMLNQVAPAAANAQQSLLDVAGAMALITTRQPSQRMAATGIARLIAAFQHPDFQRGIEIVTRKLGKMESVVKAGGGLRSFPQIIKLIHDRFGALIKQKGVAEFFREITAAGRGRGRGQMFTVMGQRALAFLLNNFKDFNDLQGKIAKDNGELQRSFETMMKSPGVQWQVMINQFRALVLVIGQAVLPVFISLGRVIVSMIQWFQRLSPHTRNMITHFAAWAAIGSLVAGAILGIIGPIVALIGTLRLMGPALATAAGPWGLLALAIAAAGFYIVTHWEQTKRAYQQILDEMTLATAKFIKDYVDMFSHLPGGLGAWARRYKGQLAGVIATIKDNQQWSKSIDQMRVSLDRLYKTHPRAFISQMNQLKKLAKAFPGDKQIRDELKVYADTWKKHHPGATFDQMLQHMVGGNWDKMPKQLQDILGSTGDAADQFAQDMKRWQKDLHKTMVQARMDTLTNLQGLYEGMLQQNRDAMGQFGQGPLLSGPAFDIAKDWGIGPNLKYLVKDTQMATNRFVKWQNQLRKVGKMGIPATLIDVLRKQGPPPPGEPSLLQAIILGTPAQRQQLIRSWNRSQAVIQKQTKMDFKAEIERWRKAGISMAEALKNGLESAKIKTWFDGWVKTNFSDVINAGVKEAARQYKAENPKPVMPKATSGTTTTAGGGRGGGMTAAQRNVYITNHFPVIREVENIKAAHRHAALIAKNALKGSSGSSGGGFG